MLDFGSAEQAPVPSFAGLGEMPVRAAKTRPVGCNVGAQNHLQTTWLLVKVLYSVEQPPYCDLLRLSL